MSNPSPLVTIATYANPLEAQLHMLHLRDEGIDAFLADERLVGLMWHFAQVCGGIKLQVPADQRKLAEAILAGSFHLDEAEFDAAWRKEELAGRVNAVAIGKDAPASFDDEADDDDPIALNPREQLVDRAFRGAVLGLLLLPLQLYVFYLLAKIFLANDPLRHGRFTKAVLAAAINLPCVFLILAGIRGILSSATSPVDPY